MNEDQTMFAEMLGIRRQTSEKAAHVARSVDRKAVEAEDFVDELDVQKEVVEEMAREKAEIEESRSRLQEENLTLKAEKRALEEKIAALEGELSKAREELAANSVDSQELDAVRAENAALETKLARMGRALMAARRAAAEAAKVEIGGRRW